MNIPAEFDDIRPYSPEELPQVFEELLADPSFQQCSPMSFPVFLSRCLPHSCTSARLTWMYRRHFYSLLTDHR